MPALVIAGAALLVYVSRLRSSRALAQRELLRSRALFLDTQQIANIGSWEVDVRANKVTWSDETYRIMGFEPQSQAASVELLLKHVHPDDIAHVLQSMQEAGETERFEFAFRVVRPDGSIRHLLDRGIATVVDGALVYVRGTTQDITELKTVELAFGMATVQQMAVLDNLPDPIFLKDLNSRFVVANEPLAQIFGIPAKEMIGKTDLDFFSADQAARFAIDDRLVLESGERLIVESQTRNVLGAPIWIETTTNAYRDTAGQLAGIVGITRDVTVRHEAADSLRASARHYQLLFDRNPLPMWVFDSETLRFLTVNDAAVAHYGYDREQFLTMTIEDIRPPEAAGAFDDHRVSQTSELSDAGSFVHVTRDGRRIDAVVMVDAITMDGRDARLVLARDVTQERAARRALQVSEERYRTLFVESLAGNYVSSVDGTLLACNPTFARMMGYDSPVDACEHSTTNYYTDPAMRNEFLALVRKKKRLEMHEDALKRRDGSMLQILENVIGHFDQAGDLIEIHGFVIDVTERKRLEDELRHSQKLQAVGQLAGGIAHDFNNLLTAMKLHGEFILDEMLESDPHRADILEMQRAADRATMLTKQLLAFSRKQLLNPKVMSVNTVVDGMAPMVRRLIGEDVEVRIVLDPAAGCVLADAGQVEQVILNLAVNARDAMLHGGTFTIGSGIMVLDPARAGLADIPAGSYVSLTASDTGSGMSADVLAHIFEPFFTTKEQGKGTGLGLATVYGIVKQSGGHIWVNSAPGVGSSFEILLPRVNAMPAGAGVTPMAPRGTETILVVEDDLAVQALTRRLLERQGYTVIVANNGVEAILRVAENGEAIALVLTDVVMPSMSGGELATVLGETHPDLAVLFVSGYTDDVIVRRGLLVASASFLQKPFTAASLAKAVRNALDARPLAAMT